MQSTIRNDDGCSDDSVASWRMTVSNITVINKNHTGVYFVQCSLMINVHKPYPESRSPSSLTDFGANLTTFKAASVPRRTYNGSGGLLFSMMVACLHASTSRFLSFLNCFLFTRRYLTIRRRMELVAYTTGPWTFGSIKMAADF